MMVHVYVTTYVLVRRGSDRLFEQQGSLAAPMVRQASPTA